jgi:hypothetical protein
MKSKTTIVIALAAILVMSISAAYSKNENYSIAYNFEVVATGKCIECGDIMIKDTFIMEVPGEPLVPYRVARILLPQGATLKDIKVKHGKPIVETGFDIPCGQNPLTFSNPYAEKVAKSSSYDSNNWYLGKLFDVISIENFKGFDIALVHLYPVDYQLKSGTAKFYPNMTVDLQFGKGMKNKLYRGLAADKTDVAAVVDNPDVIATYEDGAIPLATEEYIIITNDALQSIFQQLATYKASYVNGASVYTVSGITATYTAGDTQDKIRTFINDKYLHNGTKYVLLGGDTGVVPYRGFYVSSGGYTDSDMAADMYYGHLGGTFDNDGDGRYAEPGEEDWYAEVAVGRAPVDNTTEAQAFVNKVMNYEAATKPTRICFHQSRVQSGNSPDSRCLAYNSDNYVPGGWTIDNLFEENGTVTKTLWRNAWAAGPIAVFHIGHGNTSVYLINYENGGEVRWENSDVSSFTNTFFPWTTSVACITGQFEASDCLAEALVKDDCGAIGAIYNDNYGWFSTLNACQYSGEFCEMESRAFFSDGKQKLGDMLNQARSYLVSSASSNATYRWCFYERNLMGDPESPCLTVRGGAPPPDSVTITYPSSGQKVSGTVNVTTTVTGAIDTVKFYIDDVLQKTDTSSPFDYSWNTTGYSEGNHTVKAEGYVGGVLKDTDSVTCEVDNVIDYYVTITNPTEGQTVSGTVSVTATSNCDTVKFYIDGTLVSTDASSPFSYSWNTTGYSDGNHTVKAEGYAGGVLKASHQITCNVSNASSCLGTTLLSLLVLFGAAGVTIRRR